MSQVVIYHNPRCSKSRQTLEMIREQGQEPEIIEYLKTPPSVEALKEILNTLGLEPRELMRKKEVEYNELGLKDESLDRDSLIQAMHDNPKLIERPIVINGKKAALGRPPENVLDIL